VEDLLNDILRGVEVPDFNPLASSLLKNASHDMVFFWRLLGIFFSGNESLTSLL